MESICALTGLNVTFCVDFSKCRSQTASVDRIDSNQGYLISNIQIVHKRVNIMKGNLPQEEFNFWVHQLFSHIKPVESVIKEFTLISPHKKNKSICPTYTSEICTKTKQF